MKNWPSSSRSSEEPLHFSGHLLFYELPESLTEQEYRRYWLVLSHRERERYLIHEASNLLTSAGRNQLLTFAGASGTTSAFAQYIAFGTGPTVITGSNTVVATEIYRAIPASSTISGNQVDISLQLPAGSANGILTNAGIYGVNATSTINSGTLMTLAQLNNFNKVNGTAYNVDYVITLT